MVPGQADDDTEDPQFVLHSLETGDDDWVTAMLTINSLTLEVDSSPFSGFPFTFLILGNQPRLFLGSQ